MLKHKLFIDDIVFYILSSLPNNKFDTTDIHILFYELKQKYPLCFKSLSFHTNGTQPFSDEIESILMRGYISNVIGYGNFFSDRRKELIINHIKNKNLLT